jgi:hypothetical protein
MRVLVLSICLSLHAALAGGQTVRTPPPGSTERTAICDAMRDFVARNYALRAFPKPIVFKIESIRVQGSYCHFEGFPLFKDGSQAIGTYVPDIVLSTCLEKGAKGWRVVYDLSRTDVPDAAELRRIRKAFPKRFPLSVLSPFWRRMLEQGG